MNTETAKKIINEYGKILEKAKIFPAGIPESLLPYKKEEIKEAIKYCLLLLYNNIENYQNCLGLIIGYQCLADFIPDSESIISNRVFIAIKEGDYKHRDREIFSKVINRKCEEGKILFNEIIEFLPLRDKNDSLEMIEKTYICKNCSNILFVKTILDEQGNLAIDSNKNIIFEQRDNDLFLICKKCGYEYQTIQYQKNGLNKFKII